MNFEGVSTKDQGNKVGTCIGRVLSQKILKEGGVE